MVREKVTLPQSSTIAASAIGGAYCAIRPIELKILTAGAFKSAVLALVPDYEKASANIVKIANDTVGALAKRIAAGETFDVVVMTPAAIDELTASHKVIPGSRADLACVGVGVMVRAGGAEA